MCSEIRLDARSRCTVIFGAVGIAKKHRFHSEKGDESESGMGTVSHFLGQESIAPTGRS